MAKVYGSADSKEARQEALVKYFQESGLPFDKAVSLAEATVSGGTDLLTARNTLGQSIVEAQIISGDISIPEGKKPVPINVPSLGTYLVTRTSDTTADVKPFSGTYQPPKTKS